MNTNPTRRSPDEILRSSIPFEIIQHASSMFAHAKYALVMWLIASVIIYVLTKFPILSDHGTLLSGMIALATLSSSLWIYSVKSAAQEFPLPQAGSEKEALIENLVLRHFKVCAKASAKS